MIAENSVVVIITHCRDEASLATNLLTLRSVGTGYPDARVVVVDNGSPRVLAQRIKREALPHQFIATGHSDHAETIRGALVEFADASPLVILDGDVLFWDRCDGWEFGALLAGRLLPPFYDAYSDAYTHPRLHTSHLVIPDPRALIEAIRGLEARVNVNAIAPVTVPGAHGWERFDTGSILYRALGDKAQAFTAEQLECFDHLFCGSSLEPVAPSLGEQGERLRELHEIALVNPEQLRGIWREQEEYFRTRSSS